MTSSNRAMKFTGIMILIVLLLILGMFFENKAEKELEKNIENTEETSIIGENTTIVAGKNNLISKKYDENTFKIISSSENEELDSKLKLFAKKNNINLQIDYAGTLEIMDKLNSGEKYDAVWASNSIWLYMLDSNIVKVSESKSISINPVVFAITKSKAEQLGFINQEITTRNILDAISSGNLKFTMPNPTQTNTGATAYLGFLSTLAGNPEVLRNEHLQNPDLKTNLVSLFSGLERSSGSENFLEELFINGNGTYEAVITYETSIININKKLEKMGREPLYVLYPIDGVSISDSPFAYIDNKNEEKKEEFKKIQNYLLSEEGQELLENTGRRTWYGGINANASQATFNPNWGINTSKYLVPIKYPNTEIIKAALNLYQSELRKPIHLVFCLDYSGSMKNDGYNELLDAMEYILSKEEAEKDFLQFTEKDKITVIPFSTNVIDVWQIENGIETDALFGKISTLRPSGSTNIYDSSIQALKVLSNEDLDTYNVSVVLMTDGLSNKGEYSDLERFYRLLKKDIPIFSIMFGDAVEDELLEISELTNGKVFNGKLDLKKAFKQVRGYN